MPLNANTLAMAIETELTQIQNQTPSTPITMAEFAQAIAKAVVDHIKNNAVVTVTGVQGGGGTASGTVS